ncbi:MAG: hypothetical protein Kow0089_07520 [Desulfobulbaceae bacterium]
MIVKDELKSLVNQVEPQQALAGLVEVVRELFPLVDEKAKEDFIVGLLGKTERDKVASLVDL